MPDSLGIVEVGGYAAALVVVDIMDKAADVRVLHAELNDLLGAVVKVSGAAASVKAALLAARDAAKQMQVSFVATAIHAVDPEAWKGIDSKPEHSPLLEADVVFFPHARRSENTMSENGPFAIGLIETQGLTAVMEALDTACKAGNVEVIGREKLGGGYVTVIIKGDVAAVKAAVAAGQAKLAEANLGKLIAAHVIARPSEGVLSLLPK